MTAARTLLVCAGEPSGDALGAELMAALREADPDLSFIGCGGPAMAAMGLDSLVDIDAFSVMGPVDAAKALPAARRAARVLAAAALENRVAGAVLIDSWAFSALVAQRLRRSGLRAPIIKHVAPQVWASRPDRIGKAAALFDGVMTLFDFEAPWFDRPGLACRAVGHPGFQSLARWAGDGRGPAAADNFRAEHGLGERPVLLLAPGSRKGEIARLAAPFRATAEAVLAGAPQLAVAIPVAPGKREMAQAAFEGFSPAPIFVEGEARFAAMAAAAQRGAGLVASGTISTELAICGAPMIVAYRVDPVSAFWARRVVTTDYASLVNIAAAAPVIPEFIQTDCAPAKMAPALAALLSGEGAARPRQVSAFPGALERLGVGGAPAGARAAQAVLDWL